MAIKCCFINKVLFYIYINPCVYTIYLYPYIYLYEATGLCVVTVSALLTELLVIRNWSAVEFG